MRKNQLTWIWILLLLTLALDAGPALAQSGRSWKAHDPIRPKPPIVTPGAQYLPVAPPSDAIVLFDGADLSSWRSVGGGPAEWSLAGGFMETVPGAGPIRTVRAFGDVQLHVEWASSAIAEGNGQGRGNSGVYLMGLYELQVLDSYENETYADGQAASLYGQYPPLVNASRPPGEWQSYDIVFRRPRFAADGTLLQPARMTVFHNGVLVQDNAELWGPTNWLRHLPYEAHPDKRPILLQDHANPVRYRNIWVRELAEPEHANPPPPDDRAVVQLDPEEAERYVGTYGSEDQTLARVIREDEQLFIDFFGTGRVQVLIPHSRTQFSFQWTAGSADFTLAADGQPAALRIRMAGMDDSGERRR